MTPKKWFVVVLSVVAFLWALVHYPISTARTLFALAGLMIMFGGVYGLWTGRLVDEFGIEIKGRWAYIISIVAIAVGIWILFGYRFPTSLR
jgi:hypothetical protein